jgi:hypothetical protein
MAAARVKESFASYHVHELAEGHGLVGKLKASRLSVSPASMSSGVQVSYVRDIRIILLLPLMSYKKGCLFGYGRVRKRARAARPRMAVR